MALFEQARIWIDGVDGSRWSIHGPGSHDCPVRLVEGEVSDLMDSPFTTTYTGVAGKAGKSLRAVNYQERNIVLNLNIAGRSGAHWLVVDSEFRRALSPEMPARLSVQTNRSGLRWLDVRLAEAPTVQNTIDPNEQANARMQVVLVAGDPYWRSEPLHSEYVFTGSNWTGDGVDIANPGDVPAWPKWVLTAPAKFGLPDIDLSTPVDARRDRFVYLPFQPHGREVVVDSDPFAEMITTNDGTLLWAKMNGQYFMNPLPARMPETRLPVYVDPFPLLPFNLPTTWRIWIGEKLKELVVALGVDRVLALTPEDVGRRISEWLKGLRPDWLEPVAPDVLYEMTAAFIAELIRNTYGRFGNIAGATAQIRVQPRWSRPWGLE